MQRPVVIADLLGHLPGSVPFDLHLRIENLRAALLRRASLAGDGVERPDSSLAGGSARHAQGTRPPDAAHSIDPSPHDVRKAQSTYVPTPIGVGTRIDNAA